MGCPERARCTCGTGGDAYSFLVKHHHHGLTFDILHGERHEARQTLFRVPIDNYLIDGTQTIHDCLLQFQQVLRPLGHFNAGKFRRFAHPDDTKHIRGSRPAVTLLYPAIDKWQYPCLLSYIEGSDTRGSVEL